MCELFGLNSIKKIKLNEMLKEFFSHGVDHPHGWGMAFFYDNAVSLEKQPEPSYKSLYLKQRLRSDIEVDKMMAHIRLATRGNTDYENSHPFVMRDNEKRTWTLAHNGTIFEGDSMKRFVYTQKGQTDSERILCYIISRIDKKQEEKKAPLTACERFEIVDEIVCEISLENKLNLLIYDGELLYVHTNYRNSLHRLQKKEGILVSTRPLTAEMWEEVPMNRLLAYKEGKLWKVGTDHGNEFIYSEEKMRLLFLDYSAL